MTDRPRRPSEGSNASPHDAPASNPSPEPPTPSEPPMPIPLVQRADAQEPNSGLFSAPSTRQKLDLAAAALRLRAEQVHARVVYFDPSQETNAELDKITEAVLADLRLMQAARRPSMLPPTLPPSDRDVEIELIANLRTYLEKVLEPRGTFVRHKLDTVSRRITKLFFEFVLQVGLQEGGEWRVVLPEQALYYALARARGAILADLRAMRYETPDAQERALERFHRLEKELQLLFLSHTRPVLEQLLEVYLTVLAGFFSEQFRADLGEYAWKVVRESGVKRLGATGSRIPHGAFPRFREVFEKHFLEHLVLFAQEPLLARMREMVTPFRRELVAFTTDPRVLSTVCSIMCDGFYAHLHGEGLLDLPIQWRSATEEK